MRRFLPALLLLVMTSPTVASSSAPVPTGEDVAFFEKKVRPLLVRRCQNCHSTRTKKKRGGLLLDSRVAILAGGDSGPAILPGQPAKSLLIQAVRYEHDSLAMPPAGKLPAAEIAILEEWVRRGAPYPGPAAGPTKKEGIDLAAGRKFWSFQRAATPSSARRPRYGMGQAANRLVPARRHGEARPFPSSAVDRRTLIRRVTFDLIGLPPSPDAVDDFIADGRADAYERLVERLLASPQHGERWGRFWLDLVRYCDVAEPWSESKGSPWLYRDWVVRALNEDMPYNRFVQKQLAADLMADAVPADRAALGLLGLSPSYWKELKLDHNVIKGVVAEEWEERIHTLGSTFLGLTVACARCHDHKFDPVTTQDYYALAGVFASIRQADLSLLPDGLARTTEKARVRVGEINRQLDGLRKRKHLDVAASQLISTLNAEAETLRRATPTLNDPLVPGVVESSLHVLADGPYRTRLLHKPTPQDVCVQVRGNPASTGPLVPRRFLAVLSSEPPPAFRQGSGRLDLARAIVNEGGALAARVIVNRIWQSHFGAGLVRTPSDFGKQGDRPTHPELLDDLAARFVAGGWSLKWLHREIVLSAAYRQASGTRDEKKIALDPDNRWLSRMSRRRLEVEAWRDAVLSASGTLNLRLGGPAIDLGRDDNQRRTLYGSVKRRELNDLLRLHDFPDPTTHSSGRTPTTTPLQMLFVLNSSFMRQQAAALTRRLTTIPNDHDRIRLAYRLLYGRIATPTEERLAHTFLAEAGTNRQTAWEEYAQVLLGSNEFLYVD